jgi:hypothetical protein
MSGSTQTKNKTRRLNFLQRQSFMLGYAALAFSSQFSDHQAFEIFYESLNDDYKNEFLRVGSSYLFLVKQGDWCVDIENSNPIIDYLTNSFKLVSLFALIESLSAEKHQDFYEWLIDNPVGLYPITDVASLKVHHEKYKTTFGSIRRCVAFFDRLSPNRKTELCGSIKINGKPAKSINAVAQFLYNLRSKFVHEGEFVLDIADTPVLSRHKIGSTLTELSMPHLLNAFEEGVVAYFSNATPTPDPRHAVPSGQTHECI